MSERDEGARVVGPRGLPEVASGLSEVAELAAQLGRNDELIVGALEALGDSIPYEVAAFFELEDGMLRVRAARGPSASMAVTRHRIPLDAHPALKRAFDSGGTEVLVTARGGDGEPDPFEGVVDLPPRHPCLIVPVLAGTERIGVLTFATAGKTYTREVTDLATVYGALIGLGLAAQARARRLEQLRDRLTEQNRLLVEEVAADTDACRALEMSESKVMRRLVRMAKQVAVTDAPVLVTGETGTGKEVMARAIHGWSTRADQAFVTVNCAALPETLIESELFGHRKGAFSGAVSDRPGRFRLADGGTLLLDEIGELPPETQVKLLRVLEEQTFEPVGSDKSDTVNVRIIAATNVDLEQAIDAGKFREDLFYRLHVFPIDLPPLRERMEDVPLLARHVLDRIERRAGRARWTVSEKSLKRMARYKWPGNVRELVNTLERARVFAPTGGELNIEVGLELDPSGRRARRPRKWPTLKEHEREYLERVLEKTGGKIYGPDGAAALLDVPPTTLQSRLQRLGVARSRGS